jgi:hypothetical protein
VRVIALILVLAAGCTREPVDNCPSIAAGDLVVTEVRGDEDLNNGTWVEVFNASGRTLELEGAKFRFRRPDGGAEFPVLVRRPLTVAADDYIVLGKFAPSDLPDHVDYGFLEDYDGTWLGAAAIDIETCGERVDLAKYDVLPAVGTYSLGAAPDAEANDLSSSWCFDPTPDGTPGAANTPCP